MTGGHCVPVRAAAALLALAALGCAARLSHPVLVTKLGSFVVAKTLAHTGQNDQGGTATCLEEVHQFVSLPSGESYGLNVEGGWFARSELSVSFYENGALKQVALNSDPQLDETVAAGAELVQQLGSLAASAAPARIGCPTRNVATAEEVRCVLPFEEWKRNGYRC